MIADVLCYFIGCIAGAAMFMGRRVWWLFIEANRRINADVEFMRAIPSDVEPDDEAGGWCDDH